MAASLQRPRTHLYGVACEPRRFRLNSLEYFAQSVRTERIRTAAFRAGLALLNRNVIRARAARPIEFVWDGHPLSYLPPSVLTERRVEIPISVEFLGALPPLTRALEVGNTVGLYSLRPREIVDKYEVAPGVRNIDLLDYHPVQRFGAILSVSTLEHIGYDEPTLEPGKFRASVRHLRSECLLPQGRILLTLPLAYNPEVDEFLRDLPNQEWDVGYLVRQNIFNEWTTVPGPQAFRAASRGKYPGTNAVAVVQNRLDPTDGLRPSTSNNSREH